MYMLEKLTKQQTKLMDEVRDEWIDIALHKQDFDKEEIEAGVKWLYYASNLKEPKVCIVNGIEDFTKQFTDSVRASVWASVRASVRDSVGASVVWTCLSGDADFGAWYEYWKRIGVFQNDKCDKYVGYLRSGAFLVFFFEKVAYVMVRPTSVKQDEQRRLHSTDTPAMTWKDGTELFYIHGVKFTKEQFQKQKTASISDILSWEDIDQRSVLLRERPIETLLENIEKTLIDKNEECGGYKLWEIDLPDIGKARIMTYKSWSSDKQYVKFVPPTSKKCLETIASLREITVKELKNAYKS